MPATLPRTPRRRLSSRSKKLLALTSLGVVGVIAGLLSGCSSSPSAIAASTDTPASTRYVATAGNWQFTSGARLRFAGALAVTGTTVSGRLHAVNMTCAATTSYPVTGSIAEDGTLSLASTSFAGGALAIQGTLASDQHSLTAPTVTLTGGTCAARPTTLRPENEPIATGQQYQAITGSYTGTFTDSDGASEAVDASLSQPTTPDSNGVYHLTGTATFANNPCLTSPVVTDSTVSGNQISATYTDKVTGAQVIGSGTFSADASTLTIDTWTLSGPCGADSGTGLLTQTH